LHGPGIFPHLRAGAARRQLSSKPKPGKPGKVPKHPENFRDSCARPRISFTNAPASRAALRAAGVETERTQGFKPLTLRASIKIRPACLLDGYPTDRTFAGVADDFIA